MSDERKTMAQSIIEKHGSAVDAILNHGLPENWPPSQLFELIARLAREIAEAEKYRRDMEVAELRRKKDKLRAVLTRIRRKP